MHCESEMRGQITLGQALIGVERGEAKKREATVGGLRSEPRSITQSPSTRCLDHPRPSQDLDLEQEYRVV